MYKLQKSFPNNNPDSVCRLSDMATIPFNLDNRDYKEYLEWVAQGNTPLPAEE